MPWEKSFDEGEVVGKAMKVFWEKGFEPSSMADLIAGTGIARGSLYNAFGGKRQLFIKALEKYPAIPIEIMQTMTWAMAPISNDCHRR